MKITLISLLIVLTLFVLVLGLYIYKDLKKSRIMLIHMQYRMSQQISVFVLIMQEMQTVQRLFHTVFITGSVSRGS